MDTQPPEPSRNPETSESQPRPAWEVWLVNGSLFLAVIAPLVVVGIYLAQDTAVRLRNTVWQALSWGLLVSGLACLLAVGYRARQSHLPRWALLLGGLFIIGVLVMVWLILTGPVVEKIFSDLTIYDDFGRK